MNNVPRPVELAEAVSWESPPYGDMPWPSRDPRPAQDGAVQKTRTKPPLRLLTGAHWEITAAADQAIVGGLTPPTLFSKLPVMKALDVPGNLGGPAAALRHEICSYPVSPFAGWTELEIQQWSRQHHPHAAAQPIAHFLARSRLKRAIDDRVAATTMSLVNARLH